MKNRSFTVRSLVTSELTFWLGLCAVCVYMLFPLREKLKLGFDLSGGTYLTLGVETEKAVESELIEHMQAIQAKLKEIRALPPRSPRVLGRTITLEFDSMQAAQDALSVARSLPEARNYKHDSLGEGVITLTLDPAAERAIKSDAVDRNIEVLRARVKDADIMRKGESSIIVELPDVADPQQAKAMIGRTAQLEFRLVYNDAATREDLEFEFDDGIPVDREILRGQPGDPRYYLVQRYPDVTGRMLRDASPSIGGDVVHEAVVSFRLNSVGARRFYELTSTNYGKRLAIVLDNVIISAPRINGAISDSGSISGGFTTESARELASLLKSGAYVAPVTFQEERHIGPSLGQESINQGLMSCLLGLALLLVFGFVYYSYSGLFAFLALIYNLILILVGLWWLQMPLTLPGIGGMVLTVGMAIDASILIFEHIKEEIAKDKKIREAVNTGFSEAMKVILDANITTFIVGVVLYRFGTGPIQGFAVTMMLGIVATLITGLFFLRSLFKFVLDNFHIQKLRI